MPFTAASTLDNSVADSPSMTKLFDLSGRVAFVSGGAGLLGSQISRGLAECGATVIIASRDAAKNQAFAEELTAAHGVKALGLPLDIRDSASVTDAYRSAVAAFGN